MRTWIRVKYLGFGRRKRVAMWTKFDAAAFDRRANGNTESNRGARRHHIFRPYQVRGQTAVPDVLVLLSGLLCSVGGAPVSELQWLLWIVVPRRNTHEVVKEYVLRMCAHNTTVFG